MKPTTILMAISLNRRNDTDTTDPHAVCSPDIDFFDSCPVNSVRILVIMNAGQNS